MASAIPSLLLCLLLLISPRLGSSYRTGFTNGGKHVILRSSHDSRTPSTCSTTPSGVAGSLPIMHRLSPCSPSTDQSTPSIDDAINRDALRLRALFGEPADKAGVTVPLTGTPLATLPGASDYHVAVGFGTPAQELAVGFDTATYGATLLRCNPCVAGDPCDKAFDPSRSSTLAQIPCGSRDCPSKACSAGASCTFAQSNTTYLTDTLVVSHAIRVTDFRFACSNLDGSSSPGVLDLSRDRHSLASRVALLSPATVAFSYCLPSPWDTASPGFLSFGAARPERAGRSVSYATMRTRAAYRNLYLVKLVGVSIGGLDLPVPPAALAADALVEVQTTFTYLKPDVYAALRDQFKGWMKQYIVAPPPSRELDTCYDFTGLTSVEVPTITLRFHGGAALELGIEQTMYFKDRRNIFSVACLAFTGVAEHTPGIAVIGSMAQAGTEVVYDVFGGKLGFVHDRC